MTRTKLVAALLLSFASTAWAWEARASDGAWTQYAQKSNGDLYFYDTSRVERAESLRTVWSGIRYKTTIMGASSHLSRVEIDCAQGTERVLESTFFSDKNWEDPAMSPDKKPKQKRRINEGSPAQQLSELLCN